MKELKKKKEINIVPETAKHKREEIAELITKIESAKFVKKYLPLTNIAKQNVVVEVAHKSLDSHNVFCVTTESGCFSLANGVIVSNCDSMGYFIVRRFPLVKNIVSKSSFPMR